MGHFVGSEYGLWTALAALVAFILLVRRHGRVERAARMTTYLRRLTWRTWEPALVGALRTYSRQFFISDLVAGVTVGEGAYVGAGAVLLPKVRIGSNAVIGAGAVVTRDVASRTMGAGHPARVIREAIAGYRDIGV